MSGSGIVNAMLQVRIDRIALGPLEVRHNKMIHDFCCQLFYFCPLNGLPAMQWHWSPSQSRNSLRLCLWYNFIHLFSIKNQMRKLVYVAKISSARHKTNICRNAIPGA